MIKENNSAIIFWSLIYCLTMAAIYSFLKDEFAFTSVTRNGFYFLIVLIFIIVPLRFLPFEVKRPSHLFQWIFYMLVYVPTNVSAFFSMKLDDFQFLLFLIFFCISFIILFSFNHVRINYSKRTKGMPKSIFWGGFVLLYTFFNFLIVKKFGISTSLNLNFREVYDIRAKFKTQVGDDSLSTYIEWLEYIFNPLLICIGIVHRRKLVLIVGIVGEFFIYSVAAFKTALFLPVLIISLTILVKRYFEKNKKVNIPLSFLRLGSILMITCFLIDFIFFRDSELYKYIFSNLFVRRAMLVPGYLSTKYAEYFSTHSKVYLDNSVLFNTLFINRESNYKNGIPYVIGNYISGDSAMSANTNFLADAFANFGYFGMIIYSYIASFFLFLFDRFSVNNYLIAFVLIFSISYFFSNSSLIVSLIGHGAIFALLVMYLFPNEKLR